MKIRSKPLLTGSAILQLSVFLLASCGGGGGYTQTPPPPPSSTVIVTACTGTILAVVDVVGFSFEYYCSIHSGMTGLVTVN